MSLLVGDISVGIGDKIYKTLIYNIKIKDTKYETRLF